MDGISSFQDINWSISRSACNSLFLKTDDTYRRQSRIYLLLTVFCWMVEVNIFYYHSSNWVAWIKTNKNLWNIILGQLSTVHKYFNTRRSSYPYKIHDAYIYLRKLFIILSKFKCSILNMYKYLLLKLKITTTAWKIWSHFLIQKCSHFDLHRWRLKMFTKSWQPQTT